MRSLLLFFVVVFLIIGTMVCAHGAEQPDFFDYESNYYRVRSYISLKNAQEIGTILDTYMEFFANFFRFSPHALEQPLRVRIFDNDRGFNEYLAEIIDEHRDDAVYLHSSSAQRSEIVGSMIRSNNIDQNFTQQVFVQFFRAFIQNPPLWLREGFAAYFEKLQFQNGELTFHENLTWLETFRTLFPSDLRMNPLNIPDFLSSDVEYARENINTFYPQSWGIVHYLLNTDNRDHNRMIWEALNSLDTEADLQTNSWRAYKKTFQWINTEEFLSDMYAYLGSLRTYAELIEAGIERYESGQLDEAANFLLQAIERNDESYIPYYYFGLINYDLGNYELADENYTTAIQKGQNDALVYYALGLNAFASENYDQANEHFDVSLQLDAGNFMEKIEAVRNQIADI